MCPSFYDWLEQCEVESWELAPVHVAAPECAKRTTMEVAHHMAFCFALQLAAGEDRPLPYATRFACEGIGWDGDINAHRMRVVRARRQLVIARSIEFAGWMPQRGKRPPTPRFVPAGDSRFAFEQQSAEAVERFLRNPNPQLKVAARAR